MKHLFCSLVLAFGMLCALPAGEAFAKPGNGSGGPPETLPDNGNGNGNGNGQPGAAPELDPSSAGSAVLLLAGGILCLVSRRREGETA